MRGGAPRIGGLVTAAAMLLAAACGGGNAPAPTPTESPPRAATAVAATARATTVAATPAPAAASPTTPRAPTPTRAQGATPPPVATATLSPPQPAPTQPPPPGAQSVTIIAKDVEFSPAVASITVGSRVDVTLDNQDAGVDHDIVVFDPAGNRIAATDVATGPVRQQMSFTPAVPGRYAFKCSVHPQQMNGAFSAS